MDQAGYTGFGGHSRRNGANTSQGRRNWQYFLWNVLMFEAWRRETAP